MQCHCCCSEKRKRRGSQPESAGGGAAGGAMYVTPIPSASATRPPDSPPSLSLFAPGLQAVSRYFTLRFPATDRHTPERRTEAANTAAAASPALLPRPRRPRRLLRRWRIIRATEKRPVLWRRRPARWSAAPFARSSPSASWMGRWSTGTGRTGTLSSIAWCVGRCPSAVWVIRARGAAVCPPVGAHSGLVALFVGGCCGLLCLVGGSGDERKRLELSSKGPAG